MRRERTSLTGLAQKKITTGLRRLQEAGVTPALWLKMLNARPEELKRIVTAFSVVPACTGTGLVYDAASVSRILGLSCECSDPIPAFNDDEIVIYYGGWSLAQLRASHVEQPCMWQQQNWYDDYKWRAEPGYYRVLLRVPDSDCRDWNEQVGHLKMIDEAWQPAPVVVAVTALLVHLRQTGNDLLGGGWCRCAESLPGCHVALAVSNGLVLVNDERWDDRRCDGIWLSAARRSLILPA